MGCGGCRVLRGRSVRADRSGDTRRIGFDIRNSRIAPPLDIPQEALDQGQRNRLGDFELRHGVREGPIGRGVRGLSVIDVVKPLQQGFDGAAIVCAIDGVVRLPAEGVERDGRIAHTPGQEKRGEKKSLRSAGQHLAACRQVAGRRQASIRREWLHAGRSCRECGPRTARRAGRLRDAFRRRPDRGPRCRRSCCAGGTMRSA